MPVVDPASSQARFAGRGGGAHQKTRPDMRPTGLTDLGGLPRLCGIKHFEMGGVGLLQNEIGLPD